MNQESDKVILLVPNRDVWAAKMGRYLRIRSYVENVIPSFLLFATLIACSFLAAMLYPLLSGDIAFGHPRYDHYRSGTDIALILVAASQVLYWTHQTIAGRWVRKTNTSLGLTPEGTIAEVREANSQIPQ